MTHRPAPDFAALQAQIAALVAGEDDPITLMATLSCEVFHGDPRVDWAGFYRVTAPGLLKVGPYQGGHGCLVIPFDRGVCGASARLDRTMLVHDVEAFPDHIACSSSTRSELVIPVHAGDDLIAVFDLDSDDAAAFTPADVAAYGAILTLAFGPQPPIGTDVHGG